MQMRIVSTKIISTFILIIVLFNTIPFDIFSVRNTGLPTGYKSAKDVEYVEKNGIVVNYGARNDLCTFLSKYANEFYDKDNSYATLSQNKGSRDFAINMESDLYKSLSLLMTSRHKHKTNYGETRDYYCYTDCTNNNYKYISSFYSSEQISGTWDSGKTWNREHTWPRSKCLGGDDENDIMMLRPTLKSENSGRGNTAYGEGKGFFDPGEDTRGDCARICLYIYVRYGNSEKLFGSYGVMESVDILLKWMEQDPVDTFEMGRNDSVESITGTRNVFVDYPEYAFLLFNREIPEKMPSPSKLSNVSEIENQNTTNDDQNNMNNITKNVIIVLIPVAIISTGVLVWVKKKKKN